MSRILTITLNPTVDISSEAEVVRPTRKTRTANTRYDPGGGGINVARVITTLGGDAEAVFLAGGEMGSLLGRLLGEEGIHRQPVAIAGQTRIGIVIYEKATGLEYRFVPEGPPVKPDELRPCLDAVESHGGGYVVASGSLPAGVPDDIYAQMAERAAARGVKFILDSSGAGLKTTLEKARVFLVKPSSEELEQLVGRKLDEGGIRQAASEIVSRGAAELVAVTLGADGALLVSASGILRMAAIHVRVRSAVGAGDSFVGAMVWALSQAKPTEEAFRFGVAAGAAAVMTPGTQLCKRADVFELFAKAYEAASA